VITGEEGEERGLVMKYNSTGKESSENKRNNEPATKKRKDVHQIPTFITTLESDSDGSYIVSKAPANQAQAF
jgi:hypothetical protein